LIALFCTSEAVTHLLVRGSLASGTTDRLSDVDLVVGVADERFGELVAIMDSLMRTEMGSVLPGWRDSIVADMAGVGFVYLLARGTGLQQVDLYLAPQSTVPVVQARTGAALVFERPGRLPPDPAVATVPAVRQGPQELIIEALVVEYLIRKRIARGDHHVAYSEGFLFATAAKNLVKATLAPDSRFYGWYRLREEIAVTPIGRACLDDLDAIIGGPAVPTPASLDRGLALVLAIAQRAAPEALAPLGTVIDLYWPGSGSR
jgi:hypothetical protein